MAFGPGRSERRLDRRGQTSEGAFVLGDDVRGKCPIFAQLASTVCMSKPEILGGGREEGCVSVTFLLHADVMNCKSAFKTLYKAVANILPPRYGH